MASHGTGTAPGSPHERPLYPATTALQRTEAAAYSYADADIQDRILMSEPNCRAKQHTELREHACANGARIWSPDDRRLCGNMQGDEDVPLFVNQEATLFPER